MFVETPANPTLAICDLAAVARIGKQHGVLTIADNTWASPAHQLPLELGIDAVVHSATKYLAGHSDVVAGVAVGTRECIERVWMMRKILGACLSPNDAWLVLRGIRTLGVRVPRQNQTAQLLAEYLDGHAGVSAVHYPRSCGSHAGADPGLDRPRVGGRPDCRFRADTGARKLAGQLLNQRLHARTHIVCTQTRTD